MSKKPTNENPKDTNRTPKTDSTPETVDRPGRPPSAPPSCYANKFHQGNGEDGKHYWLTPPDLMADLQAEFGFDFDPCPYPRPEGFDGLTCEWGQSNYANIPFGSTIHNGRKKGPTAWMRKAIEEHKKGKLVVMVYPIDKWILMMLAAGAKVRNLGDVRWCATEDGTQGKGTGRHIAAFILDPHNMPAKDVRSTGLLACPFCGQFPRVTKYPMEGAHPDNDLCRCETAGCPMAKAGAVFRDRWNTHHAKAKDV